MASKVAKKVRRAKLPKPGTYQITVKEVLGIGMYPDEVATVTDTDNRVWKIPEDRGLCESGKKPLVSRWNIREGTRLEIVVACWPRPIKYISRVFVL